MYIIHYQKMSKNLCILIKQLINVAAYMVGNNDYYILN